VILLWGLAQDGTMQAVRAWLARLGADVTFVSHAAIARTRVVYRSTPAPTYDLTCDGHSICLDDVTAAYLRPYDPRDYESPAAGATAPVVHEMMSAWAEHTPALVINRPWAEATNHSKLYQAMRIAKAGFAVPESLVTNDRDHARAFAARHGSLIYKSMSAVRSVVRELDVAALDRIRDMGPVLFQRRVKGANVRVHVVAEWTAACAIASDAVDYRYGAASAEPCTIPDDIAARCVALARDLGLAIAGLDLIAGEDRRWYCLEVNPNPGFSYYDIAREEPIARRVAELLMAERPVNSSR
jgi:glutathione synthase/RimK-type ligase-like ATP-grasp enzyme